MKLIYPITKYLLPALIFLAVPAGALAAPRLYLNPANIIVTVGNQTTLELIIDTNGQEAAAADAVISFPPALIQVSSITAGTFFPELTKTENNLTGNIDIHGYFDPGSTVITKSGLGVIASIAIKGITISDANLEFACTQGSTADSNIADANGQDIINCLQTSGAGLSIVSAGGDVLITPTPTPSQLPEAGNTIPATTLLLLGSILVLSGLFLSMKYQLNHI